uniref:Thrombospondin type 1 domain protein n=1 Tax=Panagrolaimus sp. ES5 TaxID=591445 RepID=A0AC34FTB7_9BILA
MTLAVDMELPQAEEGFVLPNLPDVLACEHFLKQYLIYKRFCLRGNSTQTSVPCNLLPCSDRAPCAAGLTLSFIGGVIICVNNETLPIRPSTCCPPFGIWEMWGSWSNCSSTCGGCAQASRTRTCASEKYGCPCENSTTTETQACNRNACSTGTKCCTPLIPFTLSSGEILCYPPTLNVSIPTTPAPATTTVGTGGWSEWSVASCTASCGLCGRVIKKRVCQSGTTCIGESQMNTTQICGGPTLCPLGLGLSSCCAPAYRAIVGDEFRCILSSK